MTLQDAETIDLATPTGPMRSYIFRPQAPGRYPGIVLYSEIFQVTGPIRRTAAMLAGHGFVVLVPEIYHEYEPAGTVLAYDQAGADRGNALKTTKPLDAYDTARTGGIIAIKLREGDELVSAMLVSEADDLLLVSRKGMSIRFSASDESLRPMGRDTSGNIGMHFRSGDQLLSASVINDVEGAYVFVVTEGGYAKRTSVDQYRPQNRGGIGIKVAKLEEKRGDIVGAQIVTDEDEVLVVLESGKVVRSAVAEVPAKGRDTMGVVFARFEETDSVIGVAKNSERNLETNEELFDGAEAVVDASVDAEAATTEGDA